MSGRVGPEVTVQEEAPRSRVTCSRVRIAIGCFVLIIFAIGVPIFYKLESEPPPVGVCPIYLSVLLTNFTYLRNGTIIDHGDRYPAGYYYTTNGTTRGCLCSLRPCIRKCCRKDEYFFSAGPNSRPYCKANPEPSLFDNFTLPVYNSRSTSEFANVSQDHFRILYGDPCIYGKFRLDPKEDKRDISYLLDDGTILYDGKKLDASQYCMESLSTYDSIQTFVCFPSGEDLQTKAAFTMYPIGMILSMPFLIATLFVYAVLQDLQNLHGKSLMCNVTSLLTAYVSLTVNQLWGSDVPSPWCQILAFVIQFSFLATFFWLNVMCFDIWWVFSGLRPLQGSVKEREHKKFIFYSLYAWGCPLIILIITMCIELIPSVPENFIKPQFGVEKCWFKEPEANVLYFYLPIGILVLLNIVMFVTTAFRLQVHTRETKQVLKGSESRKNDDAERQRFNLYLKLFIVMGINWVMELVSFAVGGPKSVWFVTDVGNTLQGLLIFLIFVWKRRILRLLNQKLCPKWNLVSATVTTKGSKVSSSRTSSTTLSKTVSSNPDGLAMKPIARRMSSGDDSDN